MDKLPAKPKTTYRIGARVERAIEALATGQVNSITDAAAAVGLTREGLSKAFGKPHVQALMQERIRALLRVSAVKAAQRVDQLLNSPNQMVSFRASQFALATGFGIAAPSTAGIAVQVNIGQTPGFIVDLTEPGGPPEIIGRSLIEGEAIKPALPEPRLLGHQLPVAGRQLPD